MLTWEENRWNVSAIKFISKINAFPIHLDLKNFKFQSQSDKSRQLIWKSVFCVAVLNLVFIVGRFVQSLVQTELFRLDRIVVHFLFLGGYAAEYFIAYRIFIKNPEEFVIISNQLFNKKPQPKIIISQQNKEAGKEKIHGESKAENGENSNSGKESKEKQVSPAVEFRPVFSWPLEYSLHELMALFMPIIAGASGIFAVIILGIDPNRPQLVFSTLPENFQTWFSFSITFSMEIINFSIVVTNFYLSNFTQLQFFENIQHKFDHITNRIRNLTDSSKEGEFKTVHLRNQILGEILVELRELYVFLHLFNCCFPFCIFAMKLFYMADSIFGYFCIIRYFSDQPIYATFSGYIALLCTSLYSVMYRKAFSIPQNLYEFKKLFLLAVRQKSGKSNRVNNRFPLFKREIRRFQNMGIRVGGFHTMERESTPKFIDFVVKQLVTLLVSFPRKQVV